MDLGLNGKRAIVTGASDGIGLAIAQALTAEGARVFGAARRPDGPDIDGIVYESMDLAPSGAPDALVEAAVDRLGGLDVVINNVGIGILRNGFLSISEDDWAEVMNLNLMTAIRTMRAALPHLSENGGVIVNIASVNAVVPIVEAADYSTSKAALLSVGKAVAKEYARQGVRVVTVSPGPVATPFWLGPSGIAAQVEAATGTAVDDVLAGTAEEVPLGRFLEAHEVADVVTFLVSSRASAITGTDVHVDGCYIQTM
ncbi:MAG: SDR family NAD(P)-dependent oxidoreductase [Marmoricola sp.]